jgi:hypothetical protein
MPDTPASFQDGDLGTLTLRVRLQRMPFVQLEQTI